MTPVVFGRRFGWMHAGEGTRGVVLYNTYGHEFVWTYSGMRALADALAAHGLWVLRFDYLGTGDSDGTDAAPDQFDTAVNDIGAAVAFLKEKTGVTDVTLCGFRVGAAFALEAALHAPVDALALLAPIANGRQYVRELDITRKTWLDILPPPIREMQSDNAPLNVLGQIYHDDFKRALQNIDLARSVKNASLAPARRALIMQSRTGSKDPLRDALTEAGVDTQAQVFEELTGFLQESAFNSVPKAAFAQVVNWIAGDAKEMTPREESAKWPDLQIETPEAIEHPVCIGDEKLFGILCEPRRGTSRSASIFILTNTSASPHVGDSRLSVRIARELARRGVASLRFDARGRGDSPAAPGEVQSDTPFGRIYNLFATQDAALAARWLSRQGYKSIHTFGICSGAYHALKAAVIEPTINGVISVNLPTFKRPADKTPEEMREKTRNSLAGYAFSMFEWQKWKAMLRGEKNLLNVLQFLGGYVLTRSYSRLSDMLHLDGLRNAPPELATTPLPIVRALEAKGVKTTFLYGSYDAGLDLLASYFGKLGARLAKYPSVRVVTSPELDHSLFNAGSVQQVIGLCETVVKDTNVAVEERPLPHRATAVL
ncbi:alpha/beta fold hydrolase [Caballeronia sp. BR00000012568055]|uniref:alpha/beta fold hydrolase n=1 Tax=Caballeronia sp. BR00000012568055 TaxID=2918761 RepID=UPI0023F80D40|nr:alpha/beta fold hydrolase [Caballeronia sp. BR00000012568055]